MWSEDTYCLTSQEGSLFDKTNRWVESDSMYVRNPTEPQHTKGKQWSLYK